jgi:hypothetical protein
MLLWGWVGAIFVACLVVLPIAVQQPESAVRATGIVIGFWFPAATTLLGALVAVRQPENRIAWLLLGMGFAVLVEFLVQLLLAVEPRSDSWLAVAAIVLAHVALPAAMYLAFLIPLMFPSGRFYSRWQALAAWPGAGLLIALPLVVILTEEIGPPFPSEGQVWTVDNPVGFLHGSALETTVVSMMVVLVFTAMVGVFSLARRYRRSSAVPRAQIRWIVFATSIVAAVLLVIPLTGASQSVVGALLLVTAFVILPASITVAITRYRLFDIDRIISRTLTYAVVVVALSLLFAVGAVWIPTALGLAETPLLVAASTLAIAAVFNPLRKRVQRAVDHRFNRAAYNAEVTTDELASRLSEHLTAEQIVEEWRRIVDEALEPSTNRVWINDRSLGGPE